MEHRYRRPGSKRRSSAVKRRTRFKPNGNFRNPLLDLVNHSARASAHLRQRPILAASGPPLRPLLKNTQSPRHSYLLQIIRNLRCDHPTMCNHTTMNRVLLHLKRNDCHSHLKRNDCQVDPHAPPIQLLGSAMGVGQNDPGPAPRPPYSRDQTAQIVSFQTAAALSGHPRPPLPRTPETIRRALETGAQNRSKTPPPKVLHARARWKGERLMAGALQA